MTLPVAACLIDRSETFIAANGKYAAMFNVALDRLLDRSILDFCPPEHVTNIRRDFSVFDHGGVVPDHEIVLGNTIFQVSVHPFRRPPSTEVLAISVTLTDVTSIRMMEREMQNLNAELLIINEKLAESVKTDPLTLTFNRFGLQAYLDVELPRSHRSGLPFSMLLVDVDHFKAYNDTYGHLLGDQCLIAVAKAISGTVRRPADFVGRFGGEEFVVILPETWAPGGETVAKNIQNALRQAAMPHAGSSHGYVTVSIGVASFSPTASFTNVKDAADDLFNRADKALYRAKAAGRNAIAVATDEVAEPPQ